MKKLLGAKNGVAVIFCLFSLAYVITTYSAIKNRHVVKSDMAVDYEEQSFQKESETTKTEVHTKPNINVNESKRCTEASLLGKLDVNTTEAERVYWSDVGLAYPVNESRSFLGNFTHFANTTIVENKAVFHGPTNSTRVQRIAIIIPFRDRELHLRIFLGHLLPVLRRQGNVFSVFVVEQVGLDTFNKGRIMNSGFKYASSVGKEAQSSFDCFIFHDVDMMVENDNLIYRCSKGQTVDHFSTSINKFGYNTLCCGMTVGGAVGLSSEQYEKVNGFPNNFWGWGGEDDALNARINKKGFTIRRPDQQLGRYTMIKHGKDKLNPYNRGVYTAIRVSTGNSDENGLTNLNTEVVAIEKYATFVKVLVNVGKPV